jgi:fucose permease
MDVTIRDAIMSTHNAAGFESKDASTMSITTPLGFKAGTKTTTTSYRGPLAVLALLFFMWGFLTELRHAPYDVA